jgi:hypothetical protein
MQEKRRVVGMESGGRAGLQAKLFLNTGTSRRAAVAVGGVARRGALKSSTGTFYQFESINLT